MPAAKRRTAVVVKAPAAFAAFVDLRMSSSSWRRAMGVRLAACIACRATNDGAGTTTTTSVQPAVSVPREVLVQLHDLTKRYSCEALQRKFRGVLTLLGAQQDVRVLAYSCGADSGAAAYSPSVHLHFETPEVVEGAQTTWADFDANRTNVIAETVELRPGNPASFEADDCVLLRQLQAALFPALSIHLVNSRLACQAPPSAQSRYDLSIAALI